VNFKLRASLIQDYFNQIHLLFEGVLPTNIIDVFCSMFINYFPILWIIVGNMDWICNCTDLPF